MRGEINRELFFIQQHAEKNPLVPVLSAVKKHVLIRGLGKCPSVIMDGIFVAPPLLIKIGLCLQHIVSIRAVTLVDIHLS